MICLKLIKTAEEEAQHTLRWWMKPQPWKSCLTKDFCMEQRWWETSFCHGWIQIELCVVICTLLWCQRQVWWWDMACNVLESWNPQLDNIQCLFCPKWNWTSAETKNEWWQKVEQQVTTPNCWLLSGWINRGGILLQLFFACRRKSIRATAIETAQGCIWWRTCWSMACWFRGSSVKAAEIYYEMCAMIDRHNRNCQDTLGIKNRLVTQSWSMRVNLTILLMIVVVTWLAYSQPMQGQAGSTTGRATQDLLHSFAGWRTNWQPIGFNKHSTSQFDTEGGAGTNDVWPNGWFKSWSFSSSHPNKEEEANS